jgi:hypothetical protein
MHVFGTLSLGFGWLNVDLQRRMVSLHFEYVIVNMESPTSSKGSYAKRQCCAYIIYVLHHYNTTCTVFMNPTCIWHVKYGHSPRPAWSEWHNDITIYVWTNRCHCRITVPRKEAIIYRYILASGRDRMTLTIARACVKAWRCWFPGHNARKKRELFCDHIYYWSADTRLGLYKVDDGTTEGSLTAWESRVEYRKHLYKLAILFTIVQLQCQDFFIIAKFSACQDFINKFS